MDIEKLKVLLLDDDQFNLFEFMPKPFIKKNGKILLNRSNQRRKNSNCLDEFQKNEIFYNLDPNKKIIKIRNSYSNIASKPNQDSIDRKLMTLIDQDLPASLSATLNLLTSII